MNGPRKLRAALRLLCLALLWSPAIQGAQPAPADALGGLPFDWRDDAGAPVRLSRWRGETVLLTMAYSTCRQVCGYTLHRLEELQRSADRAGTPIQVVVISYDPAVDGPASWSLYRHHHHLKRANWHFLTGSTADTERLAGALKFPYWRYDEHLLHDFQILLIQADGTIAKTLTWATRDDDPFSTAAAGCAPSDTQGCKS